MTVYVLQKGEYSRKRNILVTTDVKVAAKKYVSMINEGAFGSPFDKPCIEMWNDEDEDYPTCKFSENTKNEKQLIKYLSKSAKQISE